MRSWSWAEPKLEDGRYLVTLVGIHSLRKLRETGTNCRESFKEMWEVESFAEILSVAIAEGFGCRASTGLTIA